MAKFSLWWSGRLKLNKFNWLGTQSTCGKVVAQPFHHAYCSITLLKCYINEDTYQSHCLVDLYIFTLLLSLAVNFDSIPVNAKSKMLRTYSHSRMCRHAFKCPFQISIETDRLHSWISERVGSWKFEVLKELKVLQFYRYCTSKS